MENVTHTLIGVALGEAVYRHHARGRKAQDAAGAQSLRAGLLWAAVMGSNAPDLDFLLKPIAGGGSLGALLHHRGFTHTLLLSPVLALFSAGVGMLFARKGPPEGRAEVRWLPLLLAAWLGVLLHIAADGWNDYGIHPLWPFTNRWFYGDFIFIFEPLFWLCLLPFVFRISRSSVARVVCLLLGGAIGVAAWSGRYVSWPVAAWLSAWGLLWVFVHRRPRPVLVALSGVAAVLVLFDVSGQLVRQRVLRLVPPGEKVLQLTTTPAPSNPLCWRVILSTRKDRPEGSPPTDYTARQGVMVFRPWELGADGRFGPNNPKACPPRVFGENDALWAKVDAPSLLRPELSWAGEFRGNLKELAVALADHCRVRALLRFVRMPFWLISPRGDMIAGDLRYHFDARLGFADIQSRRGEECYAHEPAWDPPSGVVEVF